MDIGIIIAAHKKYEMPDDKVYIPLQAGAEGKEDIGYIRDDTGDNISYKNSMYSELTALYWGVKNLSCDYLGLVHYRRYFKGSRNALKFGIISGKEVREILLNYDIILPQKRNYYIESLYSHYSHTFDKSHLDIAKNIILKNYPEYMEELNAVYKRTWGYMWNMAVMRKSDFNSYCNWIFPILNQLEDVIEIEGLDDFYKRLFGRVSEILFNVWLLHNKSKFKNIKELPVISTEPVPWGRKIYSFLMAKFFGKKYRKSF